MRIYSMTATFGKLEQETLKLEPGLNVICKPNEWGKSTWCAFLVNMLYGLDTRARASAGNLPDKKRYEPWSGAPMSGSIDLCWNGRNITIQRTGNARTPLGEFRAYETDTGLNVPELTGNNCGQMLLGVERSVFARAGFIRLADLPVEQDDALRRRLNNLVTTGDESGTADRLGQTLKDLKNKCRSNKANGLIPEAEEKRESIRMQLESLQDLQQRTEALQTRGQELEEQIRQLETRKQALEYAKYQEDLEKLKVAKDALLEAKENEQALEEKVAMLPAEGEEQHLQTADTLTQALLRLQAQKQATPKKPEKPDTAKCFDGADALGAQNTAKDDFAAWQQNVLKKTQANSKIAIGAMLAGVMIIGALLLTPPLCFVAMAGAAVGLILLGIGISANGKIAKQGQLLQEKYGTILPENWLTEAQKYAAYCQAEDAYNAYIGRLSQEEADLQEKTRAFAGDLTLEEKRKLLEGAKQLRDRLRIAQKETQRAEEFVQTLEEMTQPVEPPTELDVLSYSYRQTLDVLESARFEQRQIQFKKAECDGQRQLQGQEPQLRHELEQEKRRITRLEAYYDAIEAAQTALTKASNELQRRFAPKISKRTQELFQAMTAERYKKVQMEENMQLRVTAEGETIPVDARLRSDGTVDQLYLSLRLAVAEELTPDAPVVLDDALVRFDDARLALAMQILSQEAQQKQIILFTCQNRETQWQQVN